MMTLLERNVFGKNILLKKFIMSAISTFFYPVFRWRNPLTFKGADKIRELPSTNVLFVSNHQTYFTDAICLHQIFAATLSGGNDSTRGLRYLLRPHDSLYYVAAAETIASGVIPRILTYGCVVCVERTWKKGERLIVRDVDLKGVGNIGRALNDGWVVTFPQGTTRPFAPGRMGTAHLIRTFKPIVMPVVLKGVGEAFGKTGFDLSRPGRPVHVEFKEPLVLDYEAAPEVILAKIMGAIEQDEAHQPAAWRTAPARSVGDGDYPPCLTAGADLPFRRASSVAARRSTGSTSAPK